MSGEGEQKEKRLKRKREVLIKKSGYVGFRH